ncbi:MAG: HAD hydrolase-like protein [Gammaproteobacteria bacterium]|nr:HAD hydrolase-like protein [Gammaproteobacteria bacterium]MBU1481661.1 HAD hydrolase-like protein [Gammaproteobacteria bacterium]
MQLTNTQQKLHERLHEKKVFVFDWDGTILDSMAMKSRNFDQAFRSVITVGSKSKLIDDVAGHYLRLSGRPRKYIFVQILNLFNLDEEQASFERFNLEFETLNKRDLIHADVFEDAFELLKELAGHNRKIFISSSVPQRELVELVEAILPDSIRNGISSVLGSEDGFAKGIGHLRWIMKETGAPCDQLLVIGDDIADYELSFEAGVDCILVDRTGTMAGNRNNAVSDLFLIKESL